MAYQQSFADESIAAIKAWQVSCSTDRGPGTYRAMTTAKVTAINDLYQTAALNMYNGFANQMANCSVSAMWNAVIARTATATASQVSAGNNPAHMTPSSTDLANRDQPAFASISSSAPSKLGGNVDALNDGAMNDSGGDVSSAANGYAPAEGDQVTIRFNTSLNKHGYDISKIIVYSAFSADRVCQNYDIDVLKAGASSWTAVFSGYDLGRDVQPAFDSDGLGREIKVLVQDGTGALLAAGIEAIRFTFHDTNGFGSGGGAETVYREVDVNGTAAVPEPCTSALLAAGLAGLPGSVWKRRRKDSSDS